MAKNWQRSNRKNRHHLKNRVYGGSDLPNNILSLDTERHKAWHFLFGNLDLQGAIRLLIRLKRMKEACRE
jgi:hypothetical protein